MITLQPAKTPDNEYLLKHNPRIGLAAAGGGPLGAIYELGALQALDESIDGLALHHLDVYVGVSAGALLAASLANQMSTAQMCRIFMGRADAEFTFKPESFLRPAYREYLRQLRRAPAVTLHTLGALLQNPLHFGSSELFEAFSKLIPTGLFDNATIAQFIERVFDVPGRSNDFRKLAAKLYIVAVELDSGAAVRFGKPGYDDVTISKAVQASTALPGLYPAVQIKGVDYVDGALRRTLNASVALDHGLDLLIGINPLVPYNAESESAFLNNTRRLSHGGLPMVLSQTFRALIHSRMQIGVKKYADAYPKSSIMLIEPNANDERIFFTNIFSYSDRRQLCDHAYQATRAELRLQAEQLNELLLPYHLSLNMDILTDETRSLKQSLSVGGRQHATVSKSLHKALDRLRHTLRDTRIHL
ncbi:MAG: patatin-like phospholipase family protein [Gammaproteobacteria bacterium]|jgi:NTE family protein|nr:patatin-like phospholipase family protein [Gammaproteobacteria bacterium]